MKHAKKNQLKKLICGLFVFLFVINGIQDVYAEDIIKCEYDANGNVTRHEYYNTDYPEVGYWLEYTYDDHGNIVSELKYNGRTKEIQTTRKYKYKYDKYGNITNVTHYYNNAKKPTSVEKFKYKYDKKGRVLSKWHYDDQTKSYRYETRYKYDKAGNVLSEWEYENGEKTRGIEYQYDKNGNVIREAEYETAYGGVTELRYLYKYKYDKYGTMTQETYYYYYSKSKKSIIVTKYENKYDEMGNVIYIAEYRKGKKIPEGELKITYDENGNKVSDEWITVLED